MSIQTSESDPCTAPRTDIPNDVLTCCGYANHNPSPPINLDDGATSCTLIPSGDHYPGRPNNNPPSHPVHLNGNATSCTPVQDNPGCPNSNLPSHPIHLNEDATSCTFTQDDPGRPNNNPPSRRVFRDRTATSCKCQNHDHYRIPCGCLNDDSHVMHANGVRHHHWCSQCLLYCYRDPVCDKLLPLPMRSSDRARVCRNIACNEPRLRSRHPYGRD